MNSLKCNCVKEVTDRAQIFDLIMGCPYGNYDACCPLYEVSKLTLPQKWEWIRSQTAEQISLKLKFHRECVENFNSVPIKTENVEGH